MTKKKLCEILDTTEPNFRFRGVDYQICVLNGRFLAGLADSEENDFWFDTIDELLYQWELQGIRFIDALAEIDFGD